MQTSLYRQPAVRRLAIIALLAEIGYAVLNLSAMQPYLRDERKFGEGVIGLVLVCFLLSEAIFKSPMGHLADRFGPKKLMFFGPMLSLGTSLISLVVPRTGGAPLEVITFLGLRVLDGVGAAMLWPAAFSAMGDAVEDDQRQEAMSLLNLCYMVAIAVAFLIGGIANDLSGTKWASLVLSAVLFAGVALAVYRLVPNEIEREHHPTADGHSTGFKEFLESIKQIPTYLILSVVTFAGIGFPMAIFKHFPRDEFDFSETKIGALIFPSAIAMAVLSVPMSRFGEKIGRCRSVHIGMGLCASGIWLIGLGGIFPFLGSPWVFGLAGMPVGIGFLLAIPAWMAAVSDIDPRRRGVNVGAIMTAQGLGAIIGAPIGAYLYERSSETHSHFWHYSPFIGCAACVTLGWLMSLRLLRDPHRAV